MWPLARTANPYHPQPASISRLLDYIWHRLVSTLARATGMVWLVVVSSKTSLSLVMTYLPLSSTDSSSPPSGGLVCACPTLALASTLALLRVCFMSSPVCFAGHCHVRIRGRGSSGCRGDTARRWIRGICCAGVGSGITDYARVLLLGLFRASQ